MSTPDPHKEWRATLYGNYSSNFSAGKEFDPRMHFHLFDQLYPRFLPSNKSGAVLDLGCGKGEWLKWMENSGFTDLTGLDLSDADLQIATANGLNAVQGNAVDFLNEHDKQFSLIHAKDLVEHLDKNELVEFAKAVHASLLPGGVFMASTFNAQAPFASATRYGDFTHEFGFTPSSMHQWLAACGFVAIQVEGIHVCPRGLKGVIRKTIYRGVSALSGFIVTLRHGTGGSGGSSNCMPDLIAVAKKP